MIILAWLTHLLWRGQEIYCKSSQPILG